MNHNTVTRTLLWTATILCAITTLACWGGALLQDDVSSFLVAFILGALMFSITRLTYSLLNQ